MLLEIFTLIYILLPKYVFSDVFDKYSKENEIKITSDNRTFLIDDYCNIPSVFTFFNILRLQFF